MTKIFFRYPNRLVVIVDYVTRFVCVSQRGCLPIFLTSFPPPGTRQNRQGMHWVLLFVEEDLQWRVPKAPDTTPKKRARRHHLHIERKGVGPLKDYGNSVILVMWFSRCLFSMESSRKIRTSVCELLTADRQSAVDQLTSSSSRDLLFEKSSVFKCHRVSSSSPSSWSSS